MRAVLQDGGQVTTGKQTVFGECEHLSVFWLSPKSLSLSVANPRACNKHPQQLELQLAPVGSSWIEARERPNIRPDIFLTIDRFVGRARHYYGHIGLQASNVMLGGGESGA